MSKKLLWSALIVLVLGIFAAFSGWYAHRRLWLNVRGNYTFAQTRGNIARLQRIKMTTADGEINVYEKDGIWYLKEAADYFVNAGQLAAFYNMLNNSVIVAADENKTSEWQSYGLDDAQKIAVETFDDDGNLLDKINISGGSSDEEFRYAKRDEYPYVYTISAVGAFSGAAGAWMPFPLLEIPAKIIENIKLPDASLSKEAVAAYLPKSASLQNLTAALSYISYQGIAFKKDFTADFPQAAPHQIRVETEIGLVYVLNVYQPAENDYWLAVSLESTRLARKEVQPFIAENQKYFADWVFNLDDSQGKILFNSRAVNLTDSFHF